MPKESRVSIELKRSGYKPWKGMWDPYSQWHGSTAIRQLHQGCVHAARAAYCGNIAYQFEHLSSHQQRMWLREMIETDRDMEKTLVTTTPADLERHSAKLKASMPAQV